MNKSVELSSQAAAGTQAVYAETKTTVGSVFKFEGEETPAVAIPTSVEEPLRSTTTAEETPAVEETPVVELEERASEDADINLMSDLTEEDRGFFLQATDVYESDGGFSTDTHEEFQAISRNIQIDHGRRKRKPQAKPQDGAWSSGFIRSCRDWATSLCRL